MKTLLNYTVVFFCVFYIVCCHNKVTKEKYAESYREVCCKYDTVKVIYTEALDYWASFRFAPIAPHVFIKHYGDDALKSMIITDTSFIKAIEHSVDQLNQIALDRELFFDTFILVLLNHYEGDDCDTLAVGSNSMWFNGREYQDTCVMKMISEKILNEDTKWAMIAQDYYVDGIWDQTAKFFE